MKTILNPRESTITRKAVETAILVPDGMLNSNVSIAAILMMIMSNPQVGITLFRQITSNLHSGKMGMLNTPVLIVGKQEKRTFRSSIPLMIC